MCHGKYHHKKWGAHPAHYYAKRAKWQRRRAGFWNTPPVNVQELDDRFELWLYAAGYQKEDFEIKLKDQTMVIRVTNKEEDIVESRNWRRREFHAAGFERYFELNEKIDKEGIVAKYEEGILKVVLPKLEGMETQRQDVLVE